MSHTAARLQPRLCSSCTNWIPEWDSHYRCLGCRTCKCLDPKLTPPCEKVCAGWKTIQWALMKDLFRTAKGLSELSPSPAVIASTASLEIKAELEKKARQQSRFSTAGPSTPTGLGFGIGSVGAIPPPPPPPGDPKVVQPGLVSNTRSDLVSNAKSNTVSASQGNNRSTLHGEGSPERTGGGEDFYSLKSYEDQGESQFSPTSSQLDRDRDLRPSRERDGFPDRRSRSRSGDGGRRSQPRRPSRSRSRSRSRDRDSRGKSRDKSRDKRKRKHSKRGTLQSRFFWLRQVYCNVIGCW